MGVACGDPGGGESPMMRLTTSVYEIKIYTENETSLMSDTMEA